MPQRTTSQPVSQGPEKDIRGGEGAAVGPPTGAQAPLLAAAGDDGLHAHPGAAAHVQAAHPVCVRAVPILNFVIRTGVT
jgi:hypothetical protein